MLQKLLVLFIIIMGCFLSEITAQTIVAFQGGEGTPADNWNFVPISNAGGPLPPGIVTTFPRTGSRSIRAGGGTNSGCSGGANCIVGGQATGCAMHGRIVQFEPVNISCLPNVQISCYHRSHSYCNGNGFDSNEHLYFEVRLNGGPLWLVVGTLSGFGDYVWNYSNSPAGVSNTVPNPFVYNVPAGTNTVEFRVRSNTNRSDEVYYIDDGSITTTSTAYNFPGTAGLWNGEVDTDWNNICNWNNRTIPTSIDDVFIPNTANNICEVLAGTTANCRDLRIDKATMAVENFSSTINVYGNVIILSNGLLDMSLAGAEGGTMNLHGNWFNNRYATFFDEGRSTINFIGSANQFITVNNDTKESFYRMGVNKPSGILYFNDDVWVDSGNFGGASSMLTLSSGLINLNSFELRIWNENFQSVSRTGGGIISELTNNSNRVTRRMNSITGNYTFPFAKADGTYIPFIFDQVSGNAGDVTVSTYGTSPNNLPWPSTPVAVTNLISGIGLSPDNRDATVDRFWQIDAIGASTANLTFSYAPSELPIPPYDNPFSLKAQRYNASSDLWQPYLPGQGANFYFVYAPSVNNFSTWTLTSEISPLPIELLFFNAKLNHRNEVDLNWITASETNNDYFTLEKSKDGFNFIPFATISGAGTSSKTLHYNAKDSNPYFGISYYRLMQTDFNGHFSYSDLAPINIDQKNNSGFEIFPNPADEYFYVYFGSDINSDSKLNISDVNGKVVREVNFTSLSASESGLIKVDRDFLAKGIYFVSTNTGEVRKLILK